MVLLYSSTTGVNESNKEVIELSDGSRLTCGFTIISSMSKVIIMKFDATSGAIVWTSVFGFSG